MKPHFVLTSILTFLLAASPAQAQQRISKTGYPIYEDYTAVAPDKSLDITIEDLQLTDKYLKYYPEGIAYADAAGLRRLYEYYRDDPEGRKTWEGMQRKALKCIPTWDISKGLGERKRYMYAFLQLKTYAELYIFTGNELVSDFIRAHLAKAAELPIDFWMHAELRKLDLKKPKGYLESSHISRMLGTVITAVRRNMTKKEIQNIETAWHDRAFVPMLNWLETPSMGNFTAVISCGVLYASKYFKDKEAWDRGVWGLRWYVSHTIEKDGSDSEGYGYYAYPAGLLFEAAMIMNEEEMKQVFEGSDIDKTMAWRLYGQMFEEDEQGATKRISYSDNGYGGIKRGHSDIPCALSRYIYKDPLAAWIDAEYSQKMNKNIMLLDAKFPDLEVKPLSPVEAGLPLARAFDNGDCFIRSGWESGAIVLGLKSGDCGARINHAHNRPELNSLTLGAYGEYFIVTCGSASYRSQIYRQHDKSTAAANTITIDGANQKFPGVCKVTRSEYLADGSYFLRSDVVDAYSQRMLDGCFRSVQFIPEGGFFIVRDFLGTKDGLDHRYDCRYHIFNRDEQTSIKGEADFIKVTRPAADLYIALNKKLDFAQEKGYMHGPGARDYDPDGPNQGAPGSATDLVWTAVGPALDICTVLFPAKKGMAAPKVKWEQDAVIVNGKRYAFLDEAPKAADPSAAELFLSFDDASNFVYDGGKKSFGTRRSGQSSYGDTYAEAGHGVFWSKGPGLEKFKFEAQTACNWGGHLCTPSGVKVKLPKVKGHRLSSVEIVSVKNSGNKKYSVTGAGEAVLNKSDEATASHTFTVTEKAEEYYIACLNGELAIKFNLVYVPE